MLEKLLHETNQIKFSTSDYHLHVLTCLYKLYMTAKKPKYYQTNQNK